jgi:hypothetical protein
MGHLAAAASMVILGVLADLLWPLPRCGRCLGRRSWLTSLGHRFRCRPIP